MTIIVIPEYKCKKWLSITTQTWKKGCTNLPEVIEDAEVQAQRGYQLIHWNEESEEVPLPWVDFLDPLGN